MAWRVQPEADRLPGLDAGLCHGETTRPTVLAHDLSALTRKQGGLRRQSQQPQKNSPEWGLGLRTFLNNEVITRLVAGEITTKTAAEELGQSKRNIRRLKQRYLERGPAGLQDGRRHPSPRRAPAEEVEFVCKTYGEKYMDYGVKHFHNTGILEERNIHRSYSWVKKVLQSHGLVPRRAKGEPRHRRRQDRSPRFGELLHLDGTTHHWFSLRPELHPTLIVVVDDATRRILYAQMHKREDSKAVLAAMKHVVLTFGRPLAVYTDRAGWAGGNQKDVTHPPAFVRALAELSIEHKRAFSPEARGRGERVNQTLQKRLVPELRLAGIATLEEANAYLNGTFIPSYNREFGREPAKRNDAFRRCPVTDLDLVFCIELERKVHNDNTVRLDGVVMQIKRQPGLRTCAGRKVVVRQHLDGAVTVWLSDRLLGRYDAVGHLLMSQVSATAA